MYTYIKLYIICINTKENYYKNEYYNDYSFLDLQLYQDHKMPEADIEGSRNILI